MDFSPLFISLKVSLISLILTVICGIFVSYKMFFYRGRLKFLFESILSLSLVLPPTVTGFFLLVLFGRKGPFGMLLNKIGINIIFSIQSAIIACFIVTLPFMYRSLMLSLSHIEKELFEVSQTLGASNFKTFIYVALPMSSRGIFTGVILSFLRALGEFGATLMIAGNIPGKTQTIPSAIYFYATGGDMKTAFIWVIFLLVLSLLFMLFANYFGGYDY